MLSRIAENFYWIGRYVERIHNTICLLDVTSLSMLESRSATPADSVWHLLLRIHLNEDVFLKLYPEVNERTVHEFLVFSPKNPGSVLSCIMAARENMRCVRNRVSKALWLITNEFYLTLKKKKPEQVLSFNREPFCRSIRDFCIAFQGTVDNSLTREDTWQFLRIGRCLERSIEITHLLELKCRSLATEKPSPQEIRQWISLLSCVDGIEAYYQTYLNRIEPKSVVELLLLNRYFPSSVKFMVTEMGNALKSLPHDRDSVPYWLLMVKLKGVLSELMTINATEIFRIGLNDYLQVILEQLYSFNDLLYKSFFVFAKQETPASNDRPVSQRVEFPLMKKSLAYEYPSSVES